ncbi:MAG: hypothetical protein PF440_06965 [Thiomicrorhabdus sp.]|jgi:hypothetical protein|nr:hypothetical protein [Thiomicrorhabdus sp.]
MLTYTPEQISNMSDDGIDLATLNKWTGENYVSDDVPYLLGMSTNASCTKTFTSYRVISPGESSTSTINTIPSFCGDWSTVMPIAEKYDMMPNFKSEDGRPLLTVLQSKTETYFPVTFVESMSLNAKRALCEVYLLLEIG